MRTATLKRFVRLPHFEEHLELNRLDCLASHRNLDTYDFVQKFLVETPPEKVYPPRLVTGDDLKSWAWCPGHDSRKFCWRLRRRSLRDSCPTGRAPWSLRDLLTRTRKSGWRNEKLRRNT